VNGISTILSSTVPVLGSLLSPTYFQYFLDKVSSEFFIRGKPCIFLLLVFVECISSLIIKYVLVGSMVYLYSVRRCDAAGSLAWPTVLSQYIQVQAYIRNGCTAGAYEF
jgi:hypothetical protein